MISQREADEIAFSNDLTGDIKDKKLAKASKSLRQTLIKENKESDEARVSAAIEIQRAYRGYSTRCNVYGTLNPKVSKTAVYSKSQDDEARIRQVADEQVVEFNPPSEQDEIRIIYEEYLITYDNPDQDPLTYDEFAERYMEALRESQQSLETPAPVQPPPPTAAQPTPIVPKTRSRLTERQAAGIIQRAWRRHIDIQVYRYYRDLINFKTRGNPALMLRCINPNEAKLLDAASGVHVKFRLAGDRFPPNIYYKIFTHRPVQDMCANSPKDYTQPTVKLAMAKDKHSNVRTQGFQDDKTNWYKRIENNGWRLVSDRLVQHLTDPITWETSNKKYQYSHDKLQRKQDVEKRKKKRKIEWMQKMYQEGMLKAKSDDPETVNLIEGAAAGMVATVQKMGPDALEDWEVDELLDWTTSLNFDEYLNSWKETATSAYSEKQVDDRVRLMTGTLDPYEFSISTGPSRYQSTQHSRNTPASSVSGQLQVNG
ncbi:protein MFI-like isoform X2 [Saccostrea echinata]|uniref:protein MFI-like isoform X2 n=1 Tax=Saccostrea echinata TaxID=191078 RepID=UPI002A8175D9|nr:protein MFI-like isoform X2 [Saccostrea echinata]